ncbi:MAG: NADH-quinone oxidoreductase subunit N [Candidatus Marsarchaeota archaeon]|jgi:NADH-quinone oxidoreductase subunit N|nr:NADH-quinone oxidoreductase subunit N [Candidatus Marsarchaeota archaeon]MCL5111620.1 NADH-quinone oxidoreductase subunit N [Candidatus Marsarchaeota archaeon]
MLPYASGQEPAIYLIAVPLLLLVVSAIAQVYSRSRKLSFVSIIVLLLISGSASLYLSGTGASFRFLSVLQANGFGSLLFGAISIAIVLIEVLSYGNTGKLQRFNMLLSFVVLGAFLVAFAYSIIAILVGVEMVILASAFMILQSGKNYVEPAVKLFVLGAVATAVFTLAMALLFPYDVNLSLVGALAAPIGKFIIGMSLVLFIGALSIESAAFPFNFWVPDVYEGAPGNITALLAGVNKKVALIALIEITMLVFAAYSASGGMPLLSDTLVILSILTMFFGNLAALVQRNIKRLFAYSSISQIGYILIGIAVATHLGVESSIFYIIAHMFMIIGAFAIVFWLESRNIRTMDEYSGLYGRNAFAAIGLTILMLSMAGIPPLVGFVGKFILFSSAVYGNLAFLAFVGVINSFISIYYYAKVMNQMFLRKGERHISMDRNIAVVVAACLVFVIAVGIFPQLLLGAASAAAAAL